MVNITADVLADMANSTVSFSDGQGNTVSHTFTSAPANIAALATALTAAIATYNTNNGANSFKAALTSSGTNLIATYSVTGATNDKTLRWPSMSYTKTTSGLETSIAKGDLTLNGVEIFNTDIASNSFGGKLNLINSFSAETGVVASLLSIRLSLLIPTTSSKVM